MPACPYIRRDIYIHLLLRRLIIMHFHPQLATSAHSVSSFIPFNEPTLVHLRLFHYWVRPNLDVWYCLTDSYGSSFHAFEALVLELSSCRPNIERTNNIFNAAWPYMACSQFIYRQSSFLFRSGSALDSSLSRCTDALWLLFIFICLPLCHTGIQFRFHYSFSFSFISR